MFLFLLKTASIRNKEEKDKEIELMSFSDGKEFEQFYISITKDDVLTDEGFDFKKLNKALICAFVVQKEPSKFI